MSEQDNSTEEQQTPELPRVSAMLVDARTKLGLSQKEVADRLFLTTTYIRYMDNGEFDRLPKPAFIRGYLRAYARTVSLDSDEVIATYAEVAISTQEPPEIRDVTEESVGSSRFTGPVIQTGIAGLVALIVLVLIVWALSGDDEPPPVVTVGPAVTQPAEETSLRLPQRESVNDPAASSDGQQTEASPQREESQQATAPAQMDSQDAQPAATAASEAEAPAEEFFAALPDTDAEDEAVQTQVPDGEVTVERVVMEEGVLITVDAAGEDKLELTFSDECWTEIEDGNGVSIYGDLNRDGDTLVVTGKAPFEILFGKAPAATLMFNDEQIDLARYTTRDQTAKVKLRR
ncbi:MAG: helix-turn-helix domain-containing protein [Pseudomonadales bacterium]|nr:helix-turn-helix domain-containing protein [Pseudomonadales bacterium]